jgi:hypothetical protein
MFVHRNSWTIVLGKGSATAPVASIHHKGNPCAGLTLVKVVSMALLLRDIVT